MYKSNVPKQRAVKPRFVHAICERDMIVQTFIPFFLAIHLPIEDGTWQYGPEYVFSVHINNTEIPQCSHDVTTCNSRGYNVFSQLYCVPKKDDKLSCRVRNVDVSHFGFDESIKESKIVNKWKNISDVPIEILFNKKGIENIIMHHGRLINEFNILRMIIDQLHIGDDFDDIERSIFNGITEAFIGTCNVTFEVHHRPNNRSHPNNRSFRLQLLPRGLRMTPGETTIIDKTTNLNNCSCYAYNIFHKIGNRVVNVHGKLDLESMTNRIEINEESFISSTIRKGTSTRDQDNKTYDVTNIIQIILENIQPATKDEPVVVNPLNTQILVNHYLQVC